MKGINCIWAVLLATTTFCVDSKESSGAHYIEQCKVQLASDKAKASNVVEVTPPTLAVHVRNEQSVSYTFKRGNLRKQVVELIEEHIPEINMVVWKLNDELTWPNEYTFKEKSPKAILNKVLGAYGAVGLSYINNVIEIEKKADK